VIISDDVFNRIVGVVSEKVSAVITTRDCYENILVVSKDPRCNVTFQETSGAVQIGSDETAKTLNYCDYAEPLSLQAAILKEVSERRSQQSSTNVYPLFSAKIS